MNDHEIQFPADNLLCAARRILDHIQTLGYERTSIAAIVIDCNGEVDFRFECVDAFQGYWNGHQCGTVSVASLAEAKKLLNREQREMYVLLQSTAKGLEHAQKMTSLAGKIFAQELRDKLSQHLALMPPREQNEIGELAHTVPESMPF